MPRPEGLKLFHVPGAGYDSVDLDALPLSTIVCNCFGHEQAIAEYVMAALLARHVPLVEADRGLRQRDWSYWAGAAERVHDEMAGKTIGLLGFGHIGKAIARRAKAFEMDVAVANRSPVGVSGLVDRAFTLEQLPSFWGIADFIVVSVPLTPETTGIVGAQSFALMKPSAVLVNVGRGATVDEAALYEALRSRRIAGAVIDTWYRYPTSSERRCRAIGIPVSRIDKRRNDTPHVGLDARHHLPPSADDRRQYRALRARRALHQRRPIGEAPNLMRRSAPAKPREIAAEFVAVVFSPGAEQSTVAAFDRARD